MNNEINKSHEDIFNKYKQTYLEKEDDGYVHEVLYLDDALKAMAEVAGLRDKEVEELKDYLKNLKHRVNSHYGGGFTDEDIKLAYYKRKSEEQEKEIEQLKASLDLLNRIATESKKPNI